MTRGLDGVFAELGISQYLDSFVEQGFDSWDTILDITESDLDALGVKLGHRRKLQRRIANSRGLAPDASLVSPTRTSVEEVRSENQKPEQVIPETKGVTVVTKRKYRRHPKPDDNAPERPPSAYVLFSNKMRDDLKGRNLSFTEIAKLVGENWQSLSPTEKEPFEKQALRAKEKYNQELAEYKKTSEYRRYCQYLHEFKQRQAHQSQAKDASKRLKLEAGPRSQYATGASETPISGTGSGSEGRAGSAAPMTRKRRMGSNTSMPDNYYPSAPMHLSHKHSVDESIQSPMSSQFDRDEQSPIMHGTSPRSGSRRRPTWTEPQSIADIGLQQQQHLPSLSHMFSDDPMKGVTRSSESNGFSGFMLNQPHHAPPPLQHDLPSADSMSSSNSGFSYPRTPSDASLPIHALLSNKSAVAPAYESAAPSPFFTQPSYADQTLPYPGAATGHRKAANGHRSPPALLKYASTGSSACTDGSIVSVPSTRTSVSAYESATPVSDGGAKSGINLDGMNALLRAGEIVGRRER